MVGEKGDWGKICFLFKVKETLMINLAPKQTNMAPRQIALLCNALSSQLIVYTIPEFPKYPIFMKGQR